VYALNNFVAIDKRKHATKRDMPNVQEANPSIYKRETIPVRDVWVNGRKLQVEVRDRPGFVYGHNGWISSAHSLLIELHMQGLEMIQIDIQQALTGECVCEVHIIKQACVSELRRGVSKLLNLTYSQVKLLIDGCILSDHAPLCSVKRGKGSCVAIIIQLVVVPICAIYCEACQTWLNGEEQWEEHQRGKKHLRRSGRERRRGYPITLGVMNPYGGEGPYGRAMPKALPRRVAFDEEGFALCMSESDQRQLLGQLRWRPWQLPFSQTAERAHTGVGESVPDKFEYNGKCYVKLVAIAFYYDVQVNTCLQQLQRNGRFGIDYFGNESEDGQEWVGITANRTCPAANEYARNMLIGYENPRSWIVENEEEVREDNVDVTEEQVTVVSVERTKRARWTPIYEPWQALQASAVEKLMIEEYGSKWKGFESEMIIKLKIAKIERIRNKDSKKRMSSSQPADLRWLLSSILHAPSSLADWNALVASQSRSFRMTGNFGLPIMEHVIKEIGEYTKALEVYNDKRNTASYFHLLDEAGDVMFGYDVKEHLSEGSKRVCKPKLECFDDEEQLHEGLVAEPVRHSNVLESIKTWESSS
jgi:hypothetical protein